jgi:glycine hydroxymethyltransferase
VTSGLRIGTPALTTRGLGAEEMREIAEIIVGALQPSVSDGELADLRARSSAIGDRFPLYPRLETGSAVGAA